MNTDSRDTKFTDGLERDWIRQEIAESGSRGPVDNLSPLLKWALAVALALGSLFVIASNEL